MNMFKTEIEKKSYVMGNKHMLIITDPTTTHAVEDEGERKRQSCLKAQH